MGVLTNRPLISIYLDGEEGEGFHSLVGICQGDCLSAVLFIFYLVAALKDDIHKQIPKDADDLTNATTSQQHRQDIKDNTPQKLKNHNLFVNGTKTEEREAPDRRW